MQFRHLPPILIMLLSGIIGIRLALSPVAVVGSECTPDHPYYYSDCDGPAWTATPITIIPTASENDLPDTDPPLQIPTRNATQIAELTQTPDTTPQATPSATSTVQITNTALMIPTVTATPMPTNIRTVTTQFTPTSVGIIVNETTSTITCQRHNQIIVRGKTDPYSLLLITFDGRTVGGGISYASGSYAIPLMVGDESTGMHRIQILERNTNRVIKQLTCSVP